MSLRVYVIADIGISANASIGRIALFRACRGSYLRRIAMAFCRHFSRFEMSADRACALFFTLFRAGRRFRLCPSTKAMSLRIYVIADIGISANASIGCITLCRTSRGSYLCRVFMRMRQSRNHIFSCRLADGTSISTDARRFFRWLFRYDRLAPSVSVGCRIIAKIHIAASTSIGCIALHRTGRCRYRRRIEMSRRADVMGFIGIPANTSIRGITACRASRRCHHFRILMNVRFLESITNGAFHTAIGIPTMRMIGIKGISLTLIINHRRVWIVIFNIIGYGRYFCIDADGTNIGQQNAVRAFRCNTADCRGIIKINGFERCIVENACMEGTDRSAKTDHCQLRAGIKRIIVNMADISLKRNTFHIDTVGKRAGFNAADFRRNRQSGKRGTIAERTGTNRRNRFGNRNRLQTGTIIEKTYRNTCYIRRKFKLLECAAIGKDMPIHTAEVDVGIFKFDFLQTRTPAECGITDTRDILTESNLLKTAAPSESVRSNRRQGRRKIHVIKVSCRTECAVSKAGNAIGNGIRISGSAAGIVDERFHILREKDAVHITKIGIRIVNVNASEIFAICKRSHTDRRDLLGKRDGRDAVTTAERRISDTGDAVGNDDGLQIIRIEEHTVGNGSHSCGKLDVTQIGIVAENTAVNRCDRVGKLQSRQRNAFGEGTAIDTL